MIYWSQLKKREYYFLQSHLSRWNLGVFPQWSPLCSWGHLWPASGNIYSKQGKVSFWKIYCTHFRLSCGRKNMVICGMRKVLLRLYSQSVQEIILFLWWLMSILLWAPCVMSVWFWSIYNAALESGSYGHSLKTSGEGSMWTIYWLFVPTFYLHCRSRSREKKGCKQINSRTIYQALLSSSKIPKVRTSNTIKAKHQENKMKFQQSECPHIWRTGVALIPMFQNFLLNLLI